MRRAAVRGCSSARVVRVLLSTGTAQAGVWVDDEKADEVPIRPSSPRAGTKDPCRGSETVAGTVLPNLTIRTGFAAGFAKTIGAAVKGDVMPREMSGGNAARAEIRRLVAIADAARPTRLAAARQELEKAVARVLKHAAEAAALHICGTRELPAALTALAAANCSDSREAAARRTSRAFTAHPKTLLAAHAGEELALCGAVIMLRTALAELGEAKH